MSEVVRKIKAENLGLITLCALMKAEVIVCQREESSWQKIFYIDSRYVFLFFGSKYRAKLF